MNQKPLTSNSELMISSPRRLALSEDRQLWERQVDESDQHWGWFQLYRDQHPSVRSIANAYAAYKGQETPEVLTRAILTLRAPSWFEEIATRNSWVDRARAYDEWADNDLLERLQATKVQHLIEVADLGQRLRRKAADALSVLEVVTYEVMIDDEGNPKTIEVSALSPAAIAQLARLGVDLERDALSLGMGGQVGGVTVNIANVVGGQAAGSLPNPDDDDRLLARAAEIVEYRLGGRQRQTHTNPSASAGRGQGDDETEVMITVRPNPPPKAKAKAKPKLKAKPVGETYEPAPGELPGGPGGAQ